MGRKRRNPLSAPLPRTKLGEDSFLPDAHCAAAPLLTAFHSVNCHGGAKTKADFDLTTREGLLHGGNSKKPGVIPFKAKESRLFLLVTQQEKPHMPSQAEKLSTEQLAYIEKWIDLGVPYDKPLVDKPKTAVKKPLVVTDEDRKFWSFLPLQRVEPPKIKNE